MLFRAIVFFTALVSLTSNVCAQDQHIDILGPDSTLNLRVSDTTRIAYFQFYFDIATCRGASTGVTFSRNDDNVFSYIAGRSGSIVCSSNKAGLFTVEGDAVMSSACGTIHKGFSFTVSIQGVNNVCFTSRADWQKSTLFVYDLTGRLVRSIQRDVPTGASEIDLGASSLPAGCYWYVVRGNGWSKSGKVMKLPN
jgi:hypothetical protein